MRLRNASFCALAFILAGTVPAATMAQPHTSAPGARRSHVPRLELTLAGLRLGSGSSTIEFDPKSGYYLHTDGDMASGPASVELLLTPDASEPGVSGDAPNAAQEDPGLPQVVRVRSLLLQTGLGVRIGDTPAAVEKKLGAAPTHLVFHPKTGTLVYEYGASVPTRQVLPAKTRHDYNMGKTWQYWGLYVFHHHCLWSIRLLATRDITEPQLD